MYNLDSALNGSFIDLLSLTPLEPLTLTSSLTNTPLSFSLPQELASLSSSKAPITAAMNGDDYAGDNTTTGVLLTDETPISGVIETEGDIDWFAVTISAGDVLTVSLTSSTAATEINLVDASGAILSVQEGSTTDPLTYLAQATATYYISVDTIVPIAGVTYDLTARTQTPAPDDYAGDTSTTGVVPTDGTPIAGSLELPDDIDFFAVTVGANETWNFIVTEDAAAPFGSSLVLFSSNNEALAFFSQTNTDSEIYYSFAEAGTYYLSVGDSQGNGTGNYSVTASQVADDYGDHTSTLGQIVIDGSVTGLGDYDDPAVSAKDWDWFAFDYAAGDVIKFSSVDFLSFALMDSNGNFLTSSVFENFEGYIGFTVDDLTPGQYFIAVETQFGQNYTLYADDLGPSLITGTALGETLNGTPDNDTIDALGGSDIVYGAAGNDTINGGDGNDYLRGDAGDDILDGGFGADWLRGGAGADVLNGWAGTDWADYITSSAAVTVNLETNTGTGGDAQGDTYMFIERVYGSRFDDTLTGDAGVNYLRGWSGDDVLNGGAGNDYLQGGLGADVLNGGAGSNDWAYYVSSATGLTIDLSNTANNTGEAIGDTYISIENVVGSRHLDLITGDDNNNVLRGLEGDDTLEGGNGDDYLRGDSGADILSGGAGNDWAYYAASSAAITVDLALGIASGGDAEGDQFISIERVFGSKFDDTITGDSGANYLRGFSGNDSLNGGAGTDFLQGGAGADALNGGLGTDWAYYISATAGVTVNLGFSSYNQGEAAGDSYISIESLRGSNFDDVLIGDHNNNYIVGGSGDDILVGAAGNDTLRGDAGADFFVFVRGGDQDTVIDFNDAELDKLYFEDFEFNDIAEALSYAADVNGDVVFTIGSDIITIEDTTITEITNSIVI